MDKATTPINIDALEVEFLCHPDRRFAHNLISGLRHGFYTVITNPPTQPFECKNVLSATKYADDVSLLVNKELEKGYLIGPFIKLPFDIYRAIPIGIVEGKYPGKKRLILDLSAPHNNKLHPALMI